MEAWATFCSGPMIAGEVVPLVSDALAPLGSGLI
jgi:hypothetical protein